MSKKQFHEKMHTAIDVTVINSFLIFMVLPYIMINNK